MTFLNPLYLLGLAAASIPIILHLLTLRKARVVEFSTLTFLKELQRSRIRRLKIRQWLLLALRTLVIVFAVLAFTRPAMRSTFGFLPGTHAKSSVIIVMDDSFSMFASDDGGPLVKQAKDRATAILDMMQAGDEVAVVRLSEAQQGTARFTSAVNAARDAILSTQPSFRHVSMNEALTAASVLMQQSRNINREVYVLTDEQRTHFAPGDAQLSLFDPSVRMFVLPLGAKQVANTAISEVRIENSLFEKDKPVDLSATVFNGTPSALAGAQVSVFLDGERVAQKSVEVAAGGRTQVQFSVTPKRSGFVRGFVELEDDAIPEDNKRYFAFQVPEKLRILLTPAGTKEAAILRLALQPAPDATAMFAIDNADRGAISASNLAVYDVIALSGASGMTEPAMQRLASFVRDGGGLLLLPDADGSLDAFTALLRTLGIPAPAGVNGAPGRTNQFTTFANIDYDHPLFRGVFARDEFKAAAGAKQSEQKPRIESPHLYCSVRLRSGEQARQVITTSAGDAFLVDQRFGGGRVLVCAVPASMAWSDFPVRGVFVPLLHRSMYYLASREDNVREGIIGNPMDIVLPPVTASAWELGTPSGANVRLVPRTLAQGLSFALRDLDQPGVYDLRAGGTTMRAMPVNIDESESDMSRITPDERNAWFRRIGAAKPNVLTGTANVRQAVTEARFGVELWKYMLACAIICAIAEMLVARDKKRAEAELAAKEQRTA